MRWLCQGSATRLFVSLAREDDATGPGDRLGEESPLLAEIVSASVQGRVALGARAGRGCGVWETRPPRRA